MNDELLRQVRDDGRVSGTSGCADGMACPLPRKSLASAASIPLRGGAATPYERRMPLMHRRLEGKRIAFLATDGVEQVELTDPWTAVSEAGADPKLVSIKSGRIQAVTGMDKANTFLVDDTVEQADPAKFDALVVPGGVASPDKMRMDPRAVAFVRAFFEQGKPAGVICHGPWMLVEADIVRGRTLTSYPSLKTDIRNAGGIWVDEEVHVEQGLVTSRNPHDLPAFCGKIVEEFAEGIHPEQAVLTDRAEGAFA
jgi:protease I